MLINKLLSHLMTNENKRPRGLDTLLGRLLDKRITVTCRYNLSRQYMYILVDPWTFKSQVLIPDCIYLRYYPGGGMELIFALWAAVSKIRSNFLTCHIWAWNLASHEKWPKFQKLHIHVYSFYPRGLKLRLFSVYGQWFLRYGPIFKIAIFMHETWQVAKVPEVSHILSFYPIEPKLSLFSLYG